MATPIRSKPQPVFFSNSNTSALTVEVTTGNIAIGGAGDQVVLVNSGANVAYVNFGTDNTVAAAIPVSGTPASGMPLLPNSRTVFSLGSATFLAVIASATGNTLLLTPGWGE